MSAKRVFACVLALLMCSMGALTACAGENEAAEAWIARYNELAQELNALTIALSEVEYTADGFKFDLDGDIDLMVRFVSGGAVRKLEFSTSKLDIDIPNILSALIMASDNTMDITRVGILLAEANIDAFIKSESATHSVDFINWRYNLKMTPSYGNSVFWFDMISLEAATKDGGIWDGLWEHEEDGADDYEYEPPKQKEKDDRIYRI